MSAILEAQRLSGYLNRATIYSEKALKTLEKVYSSYPKLKDQLNKRQIKDITILDLNFPDWEYRPIMVETISRVCYIYDIKAYCRRELVEFSNDVERKIYLIGPRIICSLVKVILKYLKKCKDKITSSKSVPNTIEDIKTGFFIPILIGLKGKRIDMKYKPLYNKVIKTFIIEELMLPYPPTVLLNKPHWLKSVKLKNPKFKDKYLI